MTGNVLIISPFFNPNIGGVETHLNDLCEYLQKNQYNVFVITYQPLTTEARGPRLEKKENLEIHRVGWIGYNLFHKFEPFPLVQFLYLTPILLIYTMFFLFKNSKRIEVIHAHGMNAALIANIASKIFGLRYVVSMHAIYDFENKPLLSKLCRWTLSPASQIFYLAERSKLDLINSGVRETKLSRYTQWVDQNIFNLRDKIECRKKLDLPNNFTVLFVGRLLEKKGTILLLNVAKMLPEIKFVFVGDGPTKGIMEEFSKNESNVIVVGSKPEISLYYGAADLVVVPSQYEEGFARVVLEALSSGRPVIASNKGCLPEMIGSEVGVIIEPTVENISYQIKSFYENSQTLEKMMLKCRKYGLEHYSEKNAEHIVRFYRG